MIIEYILKAKCKHCKHCGYYYPLNKDGKESKFKRYGCLKTGGMIRLSTSACDKWEFGYGTPVYCGKKNDVKTYEEKNNIQGQR